jgi:hypothetical protein
MNDELGKNSEGSGRVLIKAYSGICLDRPKKTMKSPVKIAVVPAEIQNDYLPNRV